MLIKNFNSKLDGKFTMVYSDLVNFNAPENLANLIKLE